MHRSSIHRASAFFFSCTALFYGNFAAAAINLTEHLDINGFLAQGLVYTDHNNFYGNSEDVSFRYHDAAIGFMYRPSTKWSASGQLKYRQAGQMTRDHVYIEHLFVDYKAYQTLSTQAGVRLGRIKNRYGFHNHVRDVSSTRPSVLLSNAVYPTKQEDLGLSSDAVSLYTNGYLKDWLYSIDVVFGKTFMSDQAEAEALIPPLQGNTDDQKALFGRLLVESPNGMWRFAYSQSNSGWDYSPNPGTTAVEIYPGFSVDVPTYGYPGEMEYQFRTLSAEWNIGNWQLSAERSTLDYQFSDVLAPGHTYRDSSLGYYVSLNYQVNPSLSVFYRWDKSYLFKNDRSGKRFAEEYGTQRHWHYNHANVVGFKYDIDQHWTLAAEYHNLSGASWLAEADISRTNTAAHWQMAVAQLTFRF